MSIPIEHEDMEELKKWGMGLSRIMEDCIFCRLPTRYWNKKANKPVCQNCALKHTVSEISKKYPKEDEK